MSYLVDDLISDRIASIACVFFLEKLDDIPNKELITVLAAILAAYIADTDEPEEAFLEVEVYIKERVTTMIKK